MHKIVYVLILVVGIMVITSFFIYKTSFSPSSLITEDCITIQKNTNSGTNVVMLGEDIKEAENYIDYFLKSLPFSNYKTDFNFYYVKDSPECEIYQNVALLCYSRDITKKSASCPNDQIIVLNKDHGREIRSSNYLNVMSINTNHPMNVLLHEFGHSFVNLAEEYVPAKIPSNSGGNCVSECKKFEGKNNGCYEGCSREDYIRSIESGIMRTLSTDNYGTYNTQVIIKKILSLAERKSITGNAVENANCAEQSYYLIEGSYNTLEEKGVTILNKSVATGCAGDPGAGGYEANIILKNDKKINIGNFNPELIYTDAPPAELDNLLGSPQEEIEGETYASDVSFFLKVPAVPDAKALEIREVGLAITVSIPICDDSLKGDVNGDGIVDINDVYHLDSHLNGDIINCPGNSDYNQDGRINQQDIDDLYASLENKPFSIQTSLVIKRITGWFARLF